MLPSLDYNNSVTRNYKIFKKMVDISKIKIGDKVHYVPFDGCDESLIENGMVKEMPGHTNTSIRVVYSCGGNWDDYMNYTSQLTPINKLGMGWKHNPLNL